MRISDWSSDVCSSDLVVITGRRQDRLEEVIAALGTDMACACAFDVRDDAAIDAAIAELPTAFRGIDLLVNNAGLALGTSTAQEADPEQWRHMIDTHITGLVTLTNRLVPLLIERQGALINLSSVAAPSPYRRGHREAERRLGKECASRGRSRWW